MRAFLMMVMMAGCAWGQLTVMTVERGTQRPSALVVTNVTINGVVWTNDVTYTATVARAAGAVQASDTNGWNVTAHQAWITNKQSSVTLSNFTASGWFSVPQKRIGFPYAAGDGYNTYLEISNRIFRVNDGYFAEMGTPYNDRFTLSLALRTFNFQTLNTWTEQLESILWTVPNEGTNSTFASRSWVNSNTVTPSQLSGKVDTNRTITVNGVTGTLSTNLSFTVTAGITGATVTNIVSGFNYATQTWSAAGTNATYRMTWDTTNGTFKVEEILP